MAEDILNLQLSDNARIAYSTLGPEDRRLLDGWLDHLRNWRNDAFVRSQSRRLKSDDEIYAFQTGGDFVIAFKIAGDMVIVLAIFRREALRTFEAMAGQSTP